MKGLRFILFFFILLNQLTNLLAQNPTIEKNTSKSGIFLEYIGIPAYEGVGGKIAWIGNAHEKSKPGVSFSYFTFTDDTDTLRNCIGFSLGSVYSIGKKRF